MSVSNRCYILHQGFWYGSLDGCYASLGGAVVCDEGNAAIPPACVEWDDFTFVPYADAPDTVQECLDPAYVAPKGGA